MGTSDSRLASATLANAPATRGQRQFAAVLCVLVAIATAALIPIGARGMPPMPGFVAIYQTALILAYALSAYVLFVQFRRARSLPLLTVGAGCLFTALIVFLQLLSFPGVLSPGRLFGVGPDTTTWLWTFWHLGPPIYALAYAAAVRNGHPTVPRERAQSVRWIAAAAAVLCAGACALLASSFVASLPKSVEGDDYTRLVTSGVGPSVELLTAVAFVLLWRATKGGRTVLELWLAVSLALLFCDNLITFAGAARATIGWFAGRIEALVSACVILVAYLQEIDFLHGRAEETATEREQARAELQKARDSLALALNAAGMGHWDLDLLRQVSQRSLRHDQIFGHAGLFPEWSKEILLDHVVEEDRARVAQCFAEAERTGVLSFECRVAWPDGSEHWIATSGRVYYDEAGTPVRMAGVVMDTTDRRRTEEELRQAQKMEAIGQLTGGIAHDFNNLLTVVIGGLDMIRRKPHDTDRVVRIAENALLAAERGARLTKQLLMFARRQTLRPEVINANKRLLDFEPLMRNAAGASIELVLALDPALYPARLDPAQLEAAVLNLVVNARDAMPGGGRITIETGNVVIEGAHAEQNPEIPPGAYVLLAVSDQGTGMNATTLARVFEPFFTTKEVGKGSGLGLSQVYGFVKESGGHVKIYSEVGIGTTVKIYLPKAQGGTESAVPAQDAILLRPAADGEVVLVVEDDPAVLATAVEGLAELGYKTLVAHDAQDALELLGQTDRVDILFSDVVMPGGMNGVQLAVQARRLRPDIRVLLTSGYTATALGSEHGLASSLPVLSKPYRREDLARELRLVLRGH